MHPGTGLHAKVAVNGLAPIETRAVLIRDELRIILFLVVDHKRPIHVSGEEQILGTWDPFNMRYRGVVDDALPRKSAPARNGLADFATFYILVHSRVSLGDGFHPDDLTGRKAQNHINVGCALGDRVDVVAQTVRFCEENFGEVILLRPSSQGQPQA